MAMASLAGLGSNSLGARYYLVSYLPIAAGVLAVGFVVAAGAPQEHPTWDRAVAAQRATDLGDVALLVVGVTVLAVLLQPLQLSLVRLLEGYWGNGSVGRALASPMLTRQRRRYDDLTRIVDSDRGDGPVPAAAAIADQVRRSRYPSRPLLMPTALGNALRAAEQTAGRRYGLDSVVIWPRLYPLLSAQVRTVVDDRRDQLDVTAGISVVSTVVLFVTTVLLWGDGWWLMVPVLAAALARLSYLAAVSAAVAYGESVNVAFDLHRFDLLHALHLPLPGTPAEERAANKSLSTMFRQEGPPPPAYEHPDEP
jgi:hypothetical protein